VDSTPSCPNCSSIVSSASSFCTQCGQSLDSGKLKKQNTFIPIMGGQRTGTGSWVDLKHIIIFYGLLLLFSLVFGILRQFNESLRLNIVFSGFSIVTTFGFLIWERLSVFHAFKFRSIKRKTLIELLIVCVIVVIFLFLYFSLFPLLGIPTIKLSEQFTKAHWGLVPILLVTSVEPGIVEEVAFRGIIQTKLSEILSAREALIIQAALFSVLHLSPVIFISHFVMGLLFGWIRFRTGHVYFGMLFHMVWNAAVVLQEYKF
jgi:uncharacterized protein